MSSGAFILSKYAASYGAGTNVHPIKIQPETVGLTIAGVVNIPTEVAANSPLSARVSGSKRTIGLTPRMVSFKFTGEGSATYKIDSVIRLPWLNPFTAAVAKGAVGSYLGVAIAVVGLSPEYAN